MFGHRQLIGDGRSTLAILEEKSDLGRVSGEMSHFKEELANSVA